MFAKETNNCVKNCWLLIRGREILFFCFSIVVWISHHFLMYEHSKWCGNQPNYGSSQSDFYFYTHSVTLEEKSLKVV
jgi:hypothetical protein